MPGFSESGNRPLFWFLTLRLVSFMLRSQGALNLIERGNPMNRDKFIENLKSARESRGLTQKQVSEALGVSDRTYSKWETGETEPGIELICRLAEFYSCAPADFFKDAGDGLDLRKELTELSIGQAAVRCSERIGELYLGLFDCFAANGYPSNEPIAPYAPETPANGFSEYPGGMLFLQHLGRDANLQLLMMPSQEGFGWLETEEAALNALLDLLRQPKLLRPLLEPGMNGKVDYYTPEHLAETAGLSVEETEKTLRSLERWGLCRHEDARTAGSDDGLYTSAETRLLRAMLTCAHLLAAQMAPKTTGGETA